MARFIGKTQNGQEIFAYDFKDVLVKTLGEREIEIIGSTEDVDRDGEVLTMEGWDLRAFKRNPVVLPAHDYYQPAIGKARVTKADGKLMFKIEFPATGINPVADVYCGLYKGGFMNASSVGFMPQEHQWGEKPGEPRRTFLKQELLEISLVSVPANPQALLTEKGIESAVRAGKLRGDEIKVLEGWIKSYFDRDPKNRKVFILPTVEGEEDGQQEEDPTATKQQGNPPPEGDKNEIKDLIAQEVAEYMKEQESSLIEKVIETIKEKHSTHYIDELLKAPVPSTTEATKQISELVKLSFGGTK